LGGLPGWTESVAYGVNNSGVAVGYSVVDGVDYATEWSDGNVIYLGLGIAWAINNVGQVVVSGPDGNFIWSNGGVTKLPAFGPTAINDAGQVVGFSSSDAVEWSDGKLIDLGVLPGFARGIATGINDHGQVVGYSMFPVVPEPSTWVMMLAGFAGLGLAGYRRGKSGRAN
jgi:probable HAF family extracellular repeat protein